MMNGRSVVFIFPALIILLVSLGTLLAHEYKLDALQIGHPYMRATPPGAPVSGGYLKISNTGSESDRLIGVSAEFAGKAEIHEMRMDGDVMKMRPLDDGLVIPAGEEVTLEPGGLHLMFMNLKSQLQTGEKYSARLIFEKSGEIELEFNVEQPGSHDTHDNHAE
jgi:periplasmic copper chaperone A